MQKIYHIVCQGRRVKYLILSILLGHGEGFRHSLRTAVHNLHLQKKTNQTLLGYIDKKAKYLLTICPCTFTGSERDVFSRCLKIHITACN